MNRVSQDKMPTRAVTYRCAHDSRRVVERVVEVDKASSESVRLSADGDSAGWGRLDVT